MGLIKSLSLGVGVNNKPLRGGLRRSTRLVESWSASVSKIATGTFLGNLATGAISKGLGTITTSVQSAFNFAVRDEQLETAFGTLLGGADKAKRVLGDLRDFGASTPFEFPGIADSAKKLISFGFEQERLLPTLRNLGDVAAGLDIPFADLSDIYGKARVSGKLMTEDVNQLAGRGIPIFDELAKVLGVSAGEIKDLASKGAIDFGHLEQAFQNMTGEGGKFSGMMAAQSKTAGGLISTLKDNINLQLGQIGATIFNVFDIKALIGKAIDIVQGFGPTLEWLSGKAMQLKPVFYQVFNTIGALFGLWWDVVSGVFSAVGSLFSGFGSVTMDGFVRTVVTGLAMLEYGYLNWQKVGTLVLKTIAYRMVAFGNDTVFWFTVKLPAAMKWWSENGLEIMLRFAANGLTMFENFSENVVAIFANLPALISGSMQLGDILKPINRGMIDVVTTALELPTRIEGGLERSLRLQMESLSDELGTGLQTHVSQRLKELIPAAAIETPSITPIQPPEIKTPEVPAIDASAAGKAGNQFAELAEAGTQEYRDAILRFRGLGQPGEDVAKETRDIAKEQLTQLQEVAKNIAAAVSPVPVFTIPGG